MAAERAGPKRFPRAIRRSGLSIYDSIEIGDPELWIPTPELELLLGEGLIGHSLKGLPLRTRSKVVKEHLCRTLGYPVPSTFVRTKPQFLGQYFDSYVQKSNNLQVWNEDIAPTRRYVIIRVGEGDIIVGVKVITGETLALLDSTGTLTQKYQARLIVDVTNAGMPVVEDTDILRPLVRTGVDLATASPIDNPRAGQLLPIQEISDGLELLVGKSIPRMGHDQERKRGAALHRLVCQHLGYTAYRDDGQFPDVRHQLLEVKLQTSTTIDLGLVYPASEEPLDMPRIDGHIMRHCDVRFAVFYAVVEGYNVRLRRLFLTTGKEFFSLFRPFHGRIVNKKLQIKLPTKFFGD